MTNYNINKGQEELEQSIASGVSADKVSLRTVSFWIVLGLLMVTIILYALYNMYSYNQHLSAQQAAVDARYHELEERREREHKLLHSFEVVDEEENRYRIPVDSAMTLIIDERNE